MKICSDPSCDRTDIKGRGLCTMHHGRWRRTGKTERSYREPYGPDAKCEAPDCDRRPQSRGLCPVHYGRWFETGDIGADKPILTAGGRRPAKGTVRKPCAVCGTEFQQYRTYQDICSNRRCQGRWYQAKHADRIKAYLARPEIRERKNALRRLENVADPDLARRRHLAGNIGRYGLTLDDFEAKVLAQGNRCAICGSQPDPKGKYSASRLHIDHDHETGELRALLCTRCNQGVGYFLDDPVRLRAAADYIDKWRPSTRGS